MDGVCLFSVEGKEKLSTDNKKRQIKKKNNNTNNREAFL